LALSHTDIGLNDSYNINSVLFIPWHNFYSASAQLLSDTQSRLGETAETFTIKGNNPFFDYFERWDNTRASIGVLPLLSVGDEEIFDTVFWGYPSFRMATLTIQGVSISVTSRGFIDTRSPSGVSATTPEFFSRR
jgi:hypothetical protein